MDKQTKFRMATVLFPLVAVIVGGVIYRIESNKLHRFEADLKAAEVQLASVKQLVKEMEGQKRVGRTPTLAMTSREQPVFLDMVRKTADASHIQLVRWTNAPVPAVSKADKEDSSKRIYPDDVTPIAGNVEISGRYGDIRNFLYNVLRLPRLVNMSEVKWSRGSKGHQQSVTFTLTRYVAPIGKAPEDVDPAVDISVNPAAPNAAPTAAPSTGQPGTASFPTGIMNTPQANGAVQSVMPAVSAGGK
jgi:hypothetical protein